MAETGGKCNQCLLFGSLFLTFSFTLDALYATTYTLKYPVFLVFFFLSFFCLLYASIHSLSLVSLWSFPLDVQQMPIATGRLFVPFLFGTVLFTPLFPPDMPFILS